MGVISGALTKLLVALVRAYQVLLSPWLGRRCRHLPSCSAYAIEAVQRFGPQKGGWLALKRISQCHPWGTSGYDPVPGEGVNDASQREPY